MGKRPVLAFIFVYLGGGEMRMTTLTILACILGLFAYAPPTEAAPNCPPQYQEICKQLVTVLDDNNDGNHGYKDWDGTHLRLVGDLIHYGSINHSSTNVGHWGIAATTSQLGYNADFFPSLLSQLAAAAQGGQTVYLHLPTWGGGFHHTNISLSNTPSPQPYTKGSTPNGKIVVPQGIAATMPKPLGQPQNQKVVVPQSGTAAVMPKPLGQPQNQKVVVPQGVPPTNKPKAVSLTYDLSSKNGTKIDKTTVNGHFVTAAAGSLVENEERSYLMDHNNDVWSCKISGLGARAMPNEKGEQEFAGHVETLKFRSDRLGHIPGNHPMHRGCLVSVQQ